MKVCRVLKCTEYFYDFMLNDLPTNVKYEVTDYSPINNAFHIKIVEVLAYYQ
jgi:hypothetical protein